jgi:hypothetical protein
MHALIDLMRTLIHLKYASLELMQLMRALIQLNLKHTFEEIYL